MAVLAPETRAAMRSRVLVRASDVSGRTVLDVMDSHGQLAARQTGASSVHLVSQAAGPLNGDELEIQVEVGPGARLRVASTAATIALPSAGRMAGEVSRIRTTLIVGEGAYLQWHLEPVVVAAAAVLEARTELHLALGCRVDFRDTIVLGRHGEDGGDIRSGVRVYREGAQIMSQTLDACVLDRSGRWTVEPERVVASALLARPEPWPGDAVVAGAAVAVQPTPGVLVASATGGRNEPTIAALERVIAAAAAD